MTKSIDITIPHNLGRAEARRRIDEGLARLMGQLGDKAAVGIEKRWTGDVLDFTALVMGQKITGALDVRDDEALVRLDLPGFLGMLAGKVSGRVKEQGAILLEDKRPKE